MEELLTARDFALKSGRPPRTVQQWAERGEVAGAQKLGVSWVAARTAWEAAAAVERRPGRPKNPESKPQEP